MDFVFAKLIFTLRLEKDISDRYALFGIRNDFTRAFRDAVCRGDGCGTCTEREGCPYHQTFSQGLSEDRAAVKRHQKPSLPFTFDLPILPGPPNAGEEIEIGLVLAGTAINFVRDYIRAVSLQFKPVLPDGRVAAGIVRVESLTCMDCRSRIMDEGGTVAPDGLSIISARDLVDMKTLDPNRVRLKITTPMRLLRDGRPVREFTFSSFVRPLLRRISSLAFYYYGSGTEIDYKSLSASSESITVAANAFHWTEWSGDRLGGITGSGTCEGILSDFHPFLLLGEYFHVGKGAPFGLGRYRTENYSG